MESAKPIGALEWCDLTVPDATGLLPFYRAVIGWEVGEFAMGEFSDYTLTPKGGQGAVAGLCHARGANGSLPACWMIYVRVADAAVSAERCRELGGRVLDGPRPMGGVQFCALQDPTGACLAVVSDLPPSDGRNPFMAD